MNFDRLSFVLRRRFWISLGITALWSAVMVTIWKREFVREGSALREMDISPEVLLVSFSDIDYWLDILREEKLIGSMRLSIRYGDLPDPLAEPLVLMESRTRLTLSFLRLSIPVDLRMAVEMNKEFELRTLQGVFLAAGRRIEIQAFATADNLYYRLIVAPAEAPPASGAESRQSTDEQTDASALLVPRDVCGNVPLERPILLSQIATPILTQVKTFKPGMSWVTSVSDPISGLFHSRIEIKVEAKEPLNVNGTEHQAWRLTERMGETVSTVWYDEQGHLLRRDMAGGLRLVRQDPQRIQERDPAFKGSPPPFSEIDREYILNHLDPALQDKPLEGIFPAMPRL